MFCPNGQVLRRPTDAEAGACLGITAGPRCRETLRRRRCRRGARGTRHRSVCRLGRPVGARARRPCLRRPGGRVRAHRELFRLPHRHQRHEIDGARLQPGPQVRRRSGHPAGSEEARLRRPGLALLSFAHARTQRRSGGAGEDRGDRLGRALPQAGHSKSCRFRGGRGVLLGDLCRGETLRRRGGRAGRRRQLGGAGGGVSCAKGEASASRGARRRP